MSGMENNALRLAVMALAGSLVTGCTDFNDFALHNKVAALGLDADPSDQAVRPIPDIESAKAQLGMQVFYTKTLGGDKDSACVTCHHPLLGGGDDLSLPIGVQADNTDLLGPGRTHSEVLAEAAGMEYDGGPSVPRNAPTTFNFALYQQSVFHDGRVDAVVGGVGTPDSDFGTADPSALDLVQGQALFPVTSPEEMASSAFDGSTRDEIRASLADRLSQNPAWIAAFDGVYDLSENAGVISYAMISDAIAEYETSQIFVDTPWKAYIADKNVFAISKQAKQGADLFFTSVEEGGAGCVSCHSGDFFTDEAFHNVAFPQIGRGKGDGVNGTDDFGRFRETGIEADKYAFRTPTLLNVTATGPYGHAGSYDSLEAVVRHHLNPEQALMSYDFTGGELAQSADVPMQHEDAEANTMMALTMLKASQMAGTSMLKNVELSDEQVDQLLAFLETLTDPCVEDVACLEPWIPTPEEAIDGNQLNFVLP